MNFSDPRSNVLQMGLREGMKVGDLGAGSGHYTIAASKVVGSTGRVYAIDIQEDILKHLHDSAKHSQSHNVETIWANFEKLRGTSLRDETLDGVILSNVLFQLDDKQGTIQEIKRILKTGRETARRRLGRLLWRHGTDD